ncbi:hypothetical protein [Nocardia heshunensis]
MEAFAFRTAQARRLTYFAIAVAAAAAPLFVTVSASADIVLDTPTEHSTNVNDPSGMAPPAGGESGGEARAHARNAEPGEINWSRPFPDCYPGYPDLPGVYGHHPYWPPFPAYPQYPPFPVYPQQYPPFPPPSGSASGSGGGSM